MLAIITVLEAIVNLYLMMLTLLYREDLPKLSYTTMCIKESLRLYPPVPYIAKGLSEDFYVEGNRIPKGS